MGLREIFGRSSVKQPAQHDRLFALTTAYVTLETSYDVTCGGVGGIVVQALATSDFQSVLKDTEEVVTATASEYNGTVESSWQPGTPVRWHNAGSETIVGTLLEVEPPSRLVQTFAFSGAEYAADKPSRLTWQIEPQGSVCKLTLTHEFEEESASYRGVRFGWNPVLSGLKTLLETGEPLIIGA